MSPIVVAFIEVVLVFVLFAMTRRMPNPAARWAVRVAGVLALLVLMPTGQPADDPVAMARVKAKTTEYFCYLAIPAAIVYKRSIGKTPVRRRMGQPAR